MKTNQSERRSFIKKAAMGSLAAIALPQLICDVLAEEKTRKVGLTKGDTILFQGDSITDAGRNKTETSFNNQKGLGGGYAYLAAADLLNKYPQKDLKLYNRGISGNKVYQLAERWDADALSLKPDVISVLIGVNDYWHLLKNNYKGTLEIYKKDFQALLERSRQALPDVKLVVGEPFALLGTAVDKSWFPAFYEYQKAAREIANMFNASFIPYQKIFDKALDLAPGSYWTPDGVHPSIAGARLMANAWLEVVKG